MGHTRYPKLIDLLDELGVFKDIQGTKDGHMNSARANYNTVHTCACALRDRLSLCD